MDFLTKRLLGSQEGHLDTAPLHFLGDRARNVEQLPVISLRYGFPPLQDLWVLEMTGEVVTVASTCVCV